jgi:hypothetical protein
MFSTPVGITIIRAVDVVELAHSPGEEPVETKLQ